MSQFNKFNRDRGGNNFSGRGDRQMFSAVCGKCGERCEVPFRPTGDRQVFCSECFRAQRGGEHRFVSKNADNTGGGVSSRGQFDTLNAKLDKILSILSQSKQAPMKVEAKVKEEKVRVDTVKPVKKEKVAAKKAKTIKK